MYVVNCNGTAKAMAMVVYHLLTFEPGFVFTRCACFV